MGKPLSPEHRAKISAARKGQSPSPEARAKIAESLRGRKVTDPEVLARKQEAARKAARAVKSPEGRERIAASKRGRPRSAETKAKISEALTGRVVGPHSEETRARISASSMSDTKRAQNTGVLTYLAVHKRLDRDLPRVCERCGRTDGNLDAALRKEADEERVLWCDSRKLWYSADVRDYARLCRRCHSRYDRNL